MKNARLAIGSVAFISGLSAAAAGLVAAVSLTRIAGEKLGFPDGLHWTLTAAVDIGAIGGAILWSISAVGSPNRRTGRWLNIACSAVSAAGVGMDHYANAAPEPPWGTVAFAIGAFLPLLSTWLVHGLAKLADGVRPIAPAVPAAQPAPTEADSVAAPAAAAIEPRPAPRPRRAAAMVTRPALVAAVEPVEPLALGQLKGDELREWVRERWPMSAEQIVEQTGCSRSTAFRVTRAIKTNGSDEEVITDEPAMAAS
jgi:hypothetical protein